jgi:polyisoprenoid-binding protein YceI
MHTTSKRALCALLLLAPAVAAFSRAAETLTVKPESRLWVDGTSNVRSFQCKATAFTASIETNSATATTQILAGEKALSAVDLKVIADSLDCSNGKMNEHMRKAIKAKENPVIEFKLNSYELAKGTDSVHATIAGDLTLGGTQKPITVVATVKPEGEGVLRVIGSTDFRLTDFGLKPPSLMLGTFKVHDPVKVSFDLLLQR